MPFFFEEPALLFLKRVSIVLLLIVVVVFGALFSVQNGSTVPLDLLVFQFSERSMAFWLLSAFAVGGLSGVVVSMLAIMRLKSSQLALRRQLGKHDKQLGQYDNTVVKD